MNFNSQNNNHLIIMLLQLRKNRKRFISILDAELLQKGATGSHENDELLKRQIRRSMKTSNWEFAPRAKLAVKIHFYKNYQYIPTLPRLVKYLLDILCKEVFEDDRQIEYLTACCYRPKYYGPIFPENQTSIFIEVERLTDFRQKYNLFLMLKNDYDFCSYAENNDLSLSINNNDANELQTLWPDEKTAIFLNLSPETVEKWHRMIRTQNQQIILSSNNINDYDWPDGLKDQAFIELDRLWDMSPLIFKIGGLPTTGGKAMYKMRLKNQVNELDKQFPFFGKLVAPFELDTQVRLHNIMLNKDLDNIMLYLSNIFSEELAESSSYLHGYRIYVTKIQDAPYPPRSLRFKLLPLFGIQDLENLMEETLTLGIKWINELIN